MCYNFSMVSSNSVIQFHEIMPITFIWLLLRFDCISIVEAHERISRLWRHMNYNRQLKCWERELSKFPIDWNQEIPQSNGENFPIFDVWKMKMNNVYSLKWYVCDPTVHCYVGSSFKLLFLCCKTNSEYST